MQGPYSLWLNLVLVAAVFVWVGWRLWRLRQRACSGEAVPPPRPIGTLQAYLAALVGTTVGLLIWHLLFDRHAPRVQELYTYVTMLAAMSPIGRHWSRRLRDWLTRR